MCDFKPGDEVEWVGLNGPIEPYHSDSNRLKGGVVYVVSRVEHFRIPGVFSVRLHGFDHAPGVVGFDSQVFRKVQRNKIDLSIESFLTIKSGQKEEPKRINEEKKEEVK